jgi:methionine synthase II (cobalamin-independent)
MASTPVHLVGSIGLDSVEDVFMTAGRLLRGHLRRIPDGEPGGRRMWTSWQYPVLRTTSCLEIDPQAAPVPGTGFLPLRVKPAATRDQVHVGELGYQREARASYLDFLDARNKGILPPEVRFQVSLPTPFAVVWRFVTENRRDELLAAYEEAMLREVTKICASIPHGDLAIQWDVCIEMLIWDGRWPAIPPFPGMKDEFEAQFRRLSAPVPEGVELGFHLCYGDLDGKHFVEPQDATKMVELANLIVRSAGRRVDFMHMPVPIARSDDAYFKPLRDLKLGSTTELHLGLVHHDDGVEGTRKRMAAARKYVPSFGIATECGMARARSPQYVRELLEIHAGAAG